MTRQELENKMQVLLGGRAAEHIVFGEVSTGASDDLQKVTSIARAIVMRYGMHEGLGNVVYEEDRQSFLGEAGLRFQERSFSEGTAREIDCAVRGIVSTAFERTVALLTERRGVLEAGAKQLLEKETLNEADLKVLRDELPSSHAADTTAVGGFAADAPHRPSAVAPPA